jgi:hypothetical protein
MCDATRPLQKNIARAFHSVPMQRDFPQAQASFAPHNAGQFLDEVAFGLAFRVVLRGEFVEQFLVFLFILPTAGL